MNNQEVEGFIISRIVIEIIIFIVYFPNLNTNKNKYAKSNYIQDSLAYFFFGLIGLIISLFFHKNEPIEGNKEQEECKLTQCVICGKPIISNEYNTCPKCHKKY